MAQSTTLGGARDFWFKDIGIVRGRMAISYGLSLDGIAKHLAFAIDITTTAMAIIIVTPIRLLPLEGEGQLIQGAISGVPNAGKNRITRPGGGYGSSR